MENSDQQKARRPLPIPGASPSQRPPTPVPVSTPVAPASFYAPVQQKPPPLPTRKPAGSSSTTYVPADPPPYGGADTGESPSFRLPEPIKPTASRIAEDDEGLPALITQEETEWTTGEYKSGWETENQTYWPTSNWENWGTNNDFTIDGRVPNEETNWWNPLERDRYRRPGPGFLPPILAEELHDPNHSLFSVHVSPSPNQPSHHASPELPRPTEEEIRTAIPHPHAYYCPRDNGWVVLIWKSSSMPPPIANSFKQSSKFPLPDQDRRKKTANCLGEDDQPFGRFNKTHHFHKYSKAIDSLKLTPPFRLDEWHAVENLKRGRRPGGGPEPDQGVEPDRLEETANEEEGRLLDLFICCQCSLYCVASPVIPGVIPRRHLDEFVRDKRANPAVGRSPEHSVIQGVETILGAIDNKLWKGENRMLKVGSSGFKAKVGYNANIKRIFECLGFLEELVDKDTTPTLRSPIADVTTAHGRINRRKLLRASIELTAWIADYKRIYGKSLLGQICISHSQLAASQFKDWTGKEAKILVQLDPAREMYQTAIGAHPDQIARGELSDSMRMALAPIDKAWRELGLTPTTYSPELLGFAYLAQCRCDPANTSKYFTHLSEIVSRLQQHATCPSTLQELIVLEQSRDRFTAHEVENAAFLLGFGSNNDLKVDYDEDIPDDFVLEAWRDAVKRAWRNPTRGTELLRTLNNSLRILAEHRNSERLRTVWDTQKNAMSPERAYDTLEIPKDVDDEMVITVYNMRLEETPLQIEKMQEAIHVIAEVRDSDRLRQFVTTGRDPGTIIIPVRRDLPRGLNQLGNTCYLNSLLQYFYTIKDLRESVLPMSKLDLKALEDEKLTDEDLLKHRVGGRRVTRREVIRSRKFINQLAELFFNLEFAEAAAVTPTIELAKLALVTSKDEEEEDEREETDSPNDTDATLVEDGPSRQPLRSSPGPSSSIPQKRPSAEVETDSPLSQSPKERDGFVMVPSMRSVSSKTSRGETSKAKRESPIGEGSSTSTKAPVAPRKKRTEIESGGMMFGKQHDVAECLDNCMFQIETALLRFGDMSHDPAKTSVVKRLFYGKIRQRITGAEFGSLSRSSIHEKEDLFSHLPVNVTNDGIDIYDGLAPYFDDFVEFEGKKARMEVSLVDLPPVLQIQLQRVQFNREAMQPYKSQAYVKYWETLYMDRFLDNADPVKKAKSKAIQAELTECRERALLLSEGKGLPLAMALQHTAGFLTNLNQARMPGVDEELIRRVDNEQKRIQEEIQHLRHRIESLKGELEELWKNSTEAAYVLTSVFIHRGSSPTFGHYFFYSRNLPGSPDTWFKYNDSDVTVVSKEEVLADTTGSTANPYLLVFARKDLDVVDTVKRYDPETVLQS